MGGNIFKECRRFEAAEYHYHVNQLKKELRDFVFGPTVGFQELKAYRNKESFGDCDIIVNSQYLSQNYQRHVASAFMLKEDQYSKNGNVFSFNYKGLQVDLIITAPEYVQSSIDYFNFNDFGNIIGRLMHKLGIKLGHKGLSLVLREPVSYGAHILAEIELGGTFDDALAILGLDIARYHKGFDDLEDMFEYVATSKYFDPDIYLLENRAHHSRVRDRKRKTYHAFLEWCKDTNVKSKYSFANKDERGGYSIREPYYTDIVLKRWPDVEARVKLEIKKYEDHRNFKVIINGDVMKLVTGLEGKELGMFMSEFKNGLDYNEISALISLGEEVNRLKLKYEGTKNV